MLFWTIYSIKFNNPRSYSEIVFGIMCFNLTHLSLVKLLWWFCIKRSKVSMSDKEPMISHQSAQSFKLYVREFNDKVTKSKRFPCC